MKLDLKKMQEIGAFVGGPVERTIKWSQAGDDVSAVEYEGVVYIRKNSCATFELDIKAHMSGRDSVGD